jgi:hypothetical protein
MASNCLNEAIISQWAILDEVSIVVQYCPVAAVLPFSAAVSMIGRFNFLARFADELPAASCNP